jgi:chorismate-pyruvate lyase
MVLELNGSRRALPAFDRSVHPLRRSPIQRILLTTDGTVTDILESYAGESMRLIKLFEEQTALTEAVPGLELGAGHTVLRRKILLQGKMSRTNLLFADSLVVLDRLDEWTRDGLLKSHKPIGYLIQEHRMETYREILDCGREVAGPLGAYFDVPERSGMIWRTYRVFADRKPIMLITEKFPESHFAD